MLLRLYAWPLGLIAFGALIVVAAASQPNTPRDGWVTPALYLGQVPLYVGWIWGFARLVGKRSGLQGLEKSLALAGALVGLLPIGVFLPGPFWIVLLPAFEMANESGYFLSDGAYMTLSLGLPVLSVGLLGAAGWLASRRTAALPPSKDG